MGVYRLTVNISSPSLGGQGVNNWHFRDLGDAPGTVGILNSLSELVHQFYSSIAEQLAADTVVSAPDYVVQVDGGSGDLVPGLDTWSVVSGTTINGLPPANCLVAAWRTSTAKKVGRGRTFIGPITTQALQDNGTPTETARSDIVSAGEDLISGFSGIADGGIGVWSVKEQVLRDFTGVAVANRFAVLRSRRD